MILLQAAAIPNNTNTVFNIIAVVGALAWLSPFITEWIKNKITQPSLTIIPYKQLEIGYTIFGAIINMDLSFLAKDKNALIDKIKIKLHHEKNETNTLTWNWFEEQIYQIENPELGNVPVKKNQKAIAINALNSVLVEKRIGFDLKEFKSQYDALSKEAQEVFSNYKANGNESQMVSSTEYNRLIDCFKNSFIWKIGKYKAVIEVSILKRVTPFTHTIEFELSNADLKSIEKNIETCKTVVNNRFINENEVKVKWEWLYVDIKEKL